jgi:signal transduction histidine kinase
VVSALGDAAVVILADADGILEPGAMAIRTCEGTSRDVVMDPTTWQNCSLIETTQQVFETGRSATLGACVDELNKCVWPNVTEPLRSGLVSSIHSAGRSFGALLVLCTAERTLAKGDAEVLEELARRFAVALENARLHAEAQRATRLRDDFLSVAAHELKTPVTSLRGYAQLLVRSANSPDSALLTRGLQTIDMQSDKLRQLTDKLLDVSRIDSGKLRLEPRQVDIADLVRGCVATAQDAANLHRLTVSAPPTCYGWIDALRFEQVVANLLSNAIKYSPDGGDIEVSLARRGDDSVLQQVRDHGLGIPPDRRARLFDRMYQAHGDGYLSGLGLGLFISRQIVEFHGGSIEASFPSDGGTLMCVTLPITPR